MAAASLQFNNSIRTSHCGYQVGRNPLLIQRNQQLTFSSSNCYISGLVCARIENSCRGRDRSRGFEISCERRNAEDEATNGSRGGNREHQLTCVMKFGGSSVASAERMREVAELIRSFPEERPVVVLSAMGKTTNKLLQAGEKAVSCGVIHASEIEELNFIKDLHYRTVDELGVDKSIIAVHLEELEQLLKGIAMMKELTPRTKDYIVHKRLFCDFCLKSCHRYLQSNCHSQ